jgi:putative ABC transport system ATP-binding protein
MTAALLQADALQKSFGRTQALRNASIAVAPAEVVAVTGASGSGKSTLLLCLSGVLRPEAGTVSYDGRPLPDLSDRDRSRLRRREFGLVLQFGQLVPELTAVQNVALPLLLERHSRESSYAAARSWLGRLDAGDLADMLPGEHVGQITGVEAAEPAPRREWSSPTSRPAPWTRSAATGCSRCCSPLPATPGRAWCW